MLVTECIEQIRRLDNAQATSIKEKFIADRIKNTYIPIMQKRQESQAILQNSIISIDGDEYIDVIANEIEFIGTICSLYTDITPPLGEDGLPSSVALYDAIKSSSLDELLFPRIGKDLLEYRYVNEQIIDAWERRRKN